MHLKQNMLHERSTSVTIIPLSLLLLLVYFLMQIQNIATARHLTLPKLLSQLKEPVCQVSSVLLNIGAINSVQLID